MSTKRSGTLAVLAASVMWAIEPILAKLSYQSSDYLHTSAIRAAFVTLTALGYGLVTNKGSLRVSRKQLSVLAYIAVAGTLFADLMYFFALTKVPVINAVLIGHMQPVFVILIGLLFLKQERLNRFDWLGIPFMIVSGLLVTTKALDNLVALRLGSLGDLLVLSATVAWATTGIAARKYLRGVNAGVLTLYRYLFASVVFLVYLTVTSSVTIKNIYEILVGIVVGTGTILYYEALRRIKAAQVSALELSTPFFATVLGFSILGESVTPMQVAGMLLLFGGIYCLSRREETGYGSLPDGIDHD